MPATVFIMCGRVVRISKPEELAEYFEVDQVVSVCEVPDFDVPPGDLLHIVWEEECRQLGVARWGLTPPWINETSVRSLMFNARAETIAEKVSFRDAFRHRRCVIPIDGFYEWELRDSSNKRTRNPWLIQRANSHPLAIAGLWEIQEDDDRQLRTCTVITVEANEDLFPLHPRMPAIMPKHDWASWLNHEVDSVEVLQTLLRSAPSGLLKRRTADTRLGKSCYRDELAQRSLNMGWIS